MRERGELVGRGTEKGGRETREKKRPRGGRGRREGGRGRRERRRERGGRGSYIYTRG